VNALLVAYVVLIPFIADRLCVCWIAHIRNTGRCKNLVLILLRSGRSRMTGVIVVADPWWNDNDASMVPIARHEQVPAFDDVR
jgi:hypothetical protein